MEHRVGSTDLLADGEMVEVAAGKAAVLMVRDGSTYRALSAHCTHYGAPLAKGLLSAGRISCPWHHACFDARTGDLIEPPALDALACFDVRVENDEIFVEIPDEPEDRRSLPAASRRERTDGVVAIVGAGAAGYMAAQTMRELGDQRRILMFTREERYPYDRPNLSKDYLSGDADPAWMPLRPDEFYEQHAIEVVRSARVERLDAKARAIELADGRGFTFDEAIVATGGAPRRIDVPGADLATIHMLRSFDDADAIIASAGDAKRGVVIGASFIAMEGAFSLASRGMHITVVAPDKIPFERTLGPRIGSRLQRTHEQKGVAFQLGRSVACFEGDDRVRTVVLDDGQRIPADIVVVGIGVAPATEFVSGVERTKDGGIVVDAHMRASDHIYAAGDVATYPDPRTGERIRIEHWRTALQLGRVAGANVAGVAREYDGVPFFWTKHFDTTLRYVGHVRTWDDIVYRGDVDGGSFLAYYVRDGRVHAAAAVDRDKDALKVAEAMRVKGLPTLADLPQ